MAKLQALGKYQLIKRIAVGGMSEIFLASQGGLEGFERAVIVKCVRADLETDREVLDMFLDEARTAACLKHANIVHLYDVGEDREIPYLAMEYIFGRDLLQISERARQLGQELPIWFMIKVLSDTLSALHYAYEVAEFEERPLRVVHRDISPQNIMVSFDGVTKVVDFGIAKAEARLSRTQAGILKGKYAYMSPEQVRGKTLDHRSDQFSLAVVAYEILSGTRLFQRDTDYSTMEAVDACDVPPLKVLRKDVPRKLIGVLRKALRKLPKRRYGSHAEMEQDLAKLLKGSSVEQSTQVARYMASLFATELRARDRAIADAEDSRRELIRQTGFLMLDRSADTRGHEPTPLPQAHHRYQQLVSSKGGEETSARGPILDAGEAEGEPEAEAADEVTDRGVGGTAQRPRRRRPAAVNTGRDTLVRGQPLTGGKRGKLANIGLFLAVFAAVLVLGLLAVRWFSADTAPRPDPGRSEAMGSTAREGVDGFLSVSVRGGVQVTVDGESLGHGSFQKHPLEAGPHTVILKEGPQRQTFKVRIEADAEATLAPADWQ
ncbi:MAG TPA: serine/threonine-protein kinase [Myxococcota bacterium]|nr:serine/threonine-protein kinase [Myxococcota bacterium]HRY93081.1 serine/threonine-protein kinase [Myxococcota bacterium]HSA20086.1 serine/threonine-protein kinase [Myxococcota bacterium]